MLDTFIISPFITTTKENEKISPAGDYGAKIKQIIGIGSDSAPRADRLLDPTTIESKKRISPTAKMIQAQLRAKMVDSLAIVNELNETYPDPVTALVELFEELPTDQGTWRDILEEPYG